MEIGPVAGIQIVPAVKSARESSALFTVFQIENSTRSGDETYHSHDEKAPRGLEDDESGFEEAPEMGELYPVERCSSSQFIR